MQGVWNENCIAAEGLSHYQTPLRKDEYEGVMLCRARVLSVDKVEGIKDPDIHLAHVAGGDLDGAMVRPNVEHLAETLLPLLFGILGGAER